MSRKDARPGRRMARSASSAARGGSASRTHQAPALQPRAKTSTSMRTRSRARARKAPTPAPQGAGEGSTWGSLHVDLLAQVLDAVQKLGSDDGSGGRAGGLLAVRAWAAVLGVNKHWRACAQEVRKARGVGWWRHGARRRAPAELGETPTHPFKRFICGLGAAAAGPPRRCLQAGGAGRRAAHQNPSRVPDAPP